MKREVLQVLAKVANSAAKRADGMVTFANTTRNLKVQLIRKAGEKSGG